MTAAECWACGSQASPSRTLTGVGMYECGACGHRFTPGVTTASLRELYDSEYFADYAGAGYESVEPQRRFEAARRLAQLAALKRPLGELFEIGAASGFFLDEARRAGWSVAGIEPAPSEAARAREQLRLDVRDGVLEEAELPVAGYDVVCAFHVLEHVVEPLAGLRAVHAALRPDGVLSVEVPNAASVVARRAGIAWPILGLPYHVSQFTPASLRALLDRAGFAVVAADTVPFSFYRQPMDRLHPRHAAYRVKLVGLTRTLRGVHPWRHELLRALAVPRTGSAPAAAR